MRNPDRLDSFYDELKEIHKTCFPDWRFGQFMNNFFSWLATKKRDLFFPEEKEMLEHLIEYAEKNSIWYKNLSSKSE